VEWYRYAQIVIGMEGFGASGEAGALFKHFGLSEEAICAKVRSLS
jgi:transketolase